MRRRRTGEWGVRPTLPRSWTYINDSSERQRIIVEGYVGWPGHRFERDAGDAMGFFAGAFQRMQVWAIDEETGEPLHTSRKGRVRDFCGSFLGLVGDALGVAEAELAERGEDARRAGAVGRDGSDRPEAFPGTEGEGAAPPAAKVRLAATWEMLGRGGLHARIAVLIQQALSGMEFAYVEATHEGNGRLARMVHGQKTGPAFWLLLLRLEARRHGLVTFTVGADTRAQAEAVMEAISGGLGRPKPGHAEYWRRLGIEGFAQTYFVEEPAGEAVTKRYKCFGKSREDTGPAPPMDAPAARRVR